MRLTGYRVIELVEELGWKWSEFTDETGVSRRAVYSWIYDERNPNAYSIVAISKALGVSTDYLLGLTNKRAEE